MSKIEVNTVEPQCGTTLTLGGCGQTVALGSGASQTGFGRTGTVDWITTPKVTGDSPITGVTGKGYFLNTTAGAITLNLPAGAAGSIISMADYAATWQTSNVTVTANGSEKIGGSTDDALLTTQGQSVTFVYVDSTQGWINTMDSTSNVRGAAPFIAATGGNQSPTCGLVCGDYKTHIFTGPGTLCVSNAGSPTGCTTMDYLVVAGGGGTRSVPAGGNAGGGAGGFRLSNALGDIPAPTTSPLANPTGITSAVQGYPITVGGGATNPPSIPGGTQAPNGNLSTFDTITSAGGGGAGSTGIGADGGSGGGGSQGPTPSSGYVGGAGDTPSTPIAQGFPGGAGYDGLSTSNNGGGGGGAAVLGSNAGPFVGGAGGTGSYIACAMVGPTAPSYGTPGPATGRYFAGGGGGSTDGPGTQGVGGAGGGGAANHPGAGTNGTINTGGGSGGGGPTGGGSGIVMIRYKFQ